MQHMALESCRKTCLSAAILYLAVCVCDIMNESRVNGRSVFCITSLHSLIFIGKEWSIMAVPWGAPVWSKQQQRQTKNHFCCTPVDRTAIPSLHVEKNSLFDWHFQANLGLGLGSPLKDTDCAVLTCYLYAMWPNWFCFHVARWYRWAFKESLSFLNYCELATAGVKIWKQSIEIVYDCTVMFYRFPGLFSTCVLSS